LKPVGIIANPASGKDNRRLVAYGSVFDNNEKVNIGIFLAVKTRGQEDIAILVFDDGAAQRGVFDEAQNLAAYWKLMALVICFNN
jgi:TPP-dependent pyruvate/acetoin dehydrogenase alpha subunit